MLVKAERLVQVMRSELQRRTVVRKFNQVRERLPAKVPFTSSTLCHRLWDRVFIDDHGDVYACCRHMPMPAFGNLYRETLREAWNSRTTKFWRWMTARGGLPCFDHCHLLSDEELAIQYDPEVHTATVPYERLEYVTMLFGELCNVACIMCDQEHRSKVMLTLDLIKNKIDWTHVKRITVQGGEPLAIKECKLSYIYLTEELGKEVNFMTNGLLITEEWAERIAKGSPRVPISLNATTKEMYEHIMVGARWEKMLRGVDRLNTARHRLKSKMRMVGHFTIVNENIAQIPEFVPFAKSLGFDEVNYGYDNMVPTFLNAHPELRQSVRERLAGVLETPGIDVETRILESIQLV